jgi:hypothetical protein
MKQLEETSVARALADEDLDARGVNRLWQTYFEQEIST